jgi:hypothetical protein
MCRYVTGMLELRNIIFKYLVHVHLGMYSGNMLLYTHSMYVFVCANMYLCMFACVQVCIYVYMYACM